MRRITEVLRLDAQGLSYRQISQSLGVSASTIQGYVKRTQSAGLSCPLPDDVDSPQWPGGLVRLHDGPPPFLTKSLGAADPFLGMIQRSWRTVALVPGVWSQTSKTMVVPSGETLRFTANWVVKKVSWVVA